MNFGLVKDTIIGIYPLSYKFNLLIALLEGMWTAMSHVSLMILILNAILTGAILMLLVQKITALKKLGRLRLVAGGSSLLAIVGSGCAACGLPILSLIGLGGAVLYLPFGGTELLYVSFILLAGSFYLLVRNVNAIQCDIPKARNKNSPDLLGIFAINKS